MKKRLLCLCLALLLLSSALPMASASALYSAYFDNYDVAYPVEGGMIYFDKDLGAINFCDRTVTSANIPEEIDGVAVTKILMCSFYGCEALTSVTIPETVTYIGDEAFRNCTSLTSVDLPDSLRVLGEKTFDGTSCTVHMKSGIYLDGWLLLVAAPPMDEEDRSVYVEEGTVGLASDALSFNTDFVRPFDVYLPASLRYLSPGALNYQGTVHFSEENPCLVRKDGGLFTADGKNLVYYIPQEDPFGNPLPYYEVPEGVETIEDGAFEDCDTLKIVSLPDSLVTIGNRAFRNSGLQEISFGKNVKTIGDFAFDGCDLNYVNLGESVETVGIYAFHENEWLQTVVFPATLKSIGEAAFYNCTGLKSAYFEGDVPTMGVNAFCCGEAPTLSVGYNILVSYGAIPGLKFYYWEGRTGWTELTDYTTVLWEKNVHVHDFRMELRQPSCIEEGWVNSVCACGEERQVETFHSLMHQYDAWHGNCVHCGKKDGMMDVNDGDWFAPSVYFVLKNGLMNGVSEFVFSPDAPMTRAMLVTVLWRYEGEPDAPASTFSDVKAGTWYADAVSWAASNGVVNGVGSNKFDPDGNITREQMAAILYRYSNGKGIDTGKQGSLSGFPDAGKVSSYAKTALQWAVAEGIIGGSDGKLLPQGNATRAQVATILMRFIENIAEQATTETPNELNMYMFGNSILYHGQSESIGWSGNWGMAASSAENDYAHRLNARLAGEYGQVSYAVSSISTYETAIVAQDDADYSAALAASYTEQFRAYCAEDMPEIVTIQMGENVSNTDLSASQYKSAVMQLISMVRTHAPDCGIVLCTPFWGGEAKITAVEQIAAEADNVRIARLDTLNTDENKAIGMFEHAGVAAHPNDAGMEKIAALIFDAMEPLIAENAQPHEQS